jgi:AcrR family transcriptional regulator
MNVKEKITEAALRLFSEKGYTGASVREIAEKSGVTKPTIYYYFGDKEKLYQTVLRQELSALLTNIEKRTKALKGCEEEIIGFAQGYLEYFKSRQEIIRIVLGELLGFVEGEKKMSIEFHNTIFEKAQEIFKRLKKNLTEVEAENLALSWIGYLNMVMLNSMALHKDWRVEEVVASLKIVLQYLIHHRFI